MSRQARQLPQLSGSARSAGSSSVDEDRAKKEPRAELPRHQIGVLALPAETGLRGQRLFHHRGGVDKHFHLAAGVSHQPARQLFQAGFDQFVIVIAFGVGRDGGAVLLRQDRQWIVARSVVHAEHDHRAHFGPQRARRAAPFGAGFHPHHVAVQAFGKELFEPRFGFRHGVGPGDAGDVEAARARFLDQRGFNLLRICQKSRSA